MQYISLAFGSPFSSYTILKFSSPASLFYLTWFELFELLDDYFAGALLGVPGDGGVVDDGDDSDAAGDEVCLAGEAGRRPPVRSSSC